MSWGGFYAHKDRAATGCWRSRTENRANWTEKKKRERKEKRWKGFFIHSFTRSQRKIKAKDKRGAGQFVFGWANHFSGTSANYLCEIFFHTFHFLYTYTVGMNGQMWKKKKNVWFLHRDSVERFSKVYLTRLFVLLKLPCRATGPDVVITVSLSVYLLSLSLSLLKNWSFR